MYLFRNVALEIFLSDGRNFLLTFSDVKTRDTIYSKLLGKVSVNFGESVAGISSNLSAASGVLQNLLGDSPLNELTQKWCNREISTFVYLMHLNTLAGRSYNDLTQYPVFPWILADYNSTEVRFLYKQKWSHYKYFI